MPSFDPITGMNMGRTAKDLSSHFTALADGSREVRLVKLADRLDNLQDVAMFTPERQAKQITETSKYILPIAQQTCPVYARKLAAICDKYQVA